MATSHSFGIGLEDDMGPCDPAGGLSFLVFDNTGRCLGDPDCSLNCVTLVKAAPWPQFF